MLLPNNIVNICSVTFNVVFVILLNHACLVPPKFQMLFYNKSITIRRDHVKRTIVQSLSPQKMVIKPHYLIPA